jgi:signal transduction histidine kinase
LLTYTRLVMIALLSFGYYKIVPDGQIGLKAYVITATALFFLNHFLIFKHNKWLFAILLFDTLLSFTYGFLFPGTTLYLIFLGVIAVTVFLTVADKNLLKLSAGIFFIFWLMVEHYWWSITGTISLYGNIVNVSFVIFGSIVGDLIRKLLAARETMDRQYEQLTHSHQALSEAHAELQNYSNKVEELTTVRERNRIAREIHDTVGHKMTALLVQLELSKALMKLDIEKSEETITVCENLARDALQEIRLSVRTLHQDEEEHLPLIPAIRKLLSDFYKQTGLESIFELSGDPTGLPISLQPTIIRTIQESLTNAKRHGKATSFLLKMNCKSDAVVLITKDNGAGIDSIEPGFGLINMKDRIEEHGGSVFFESSAGEGFQINVHFPLYEKLWKTGGAR